MVSIVSRGSCSGSERRAGKRSFVVPRRVIAALLRYEHVASYPTAESARAYFYEWIAFIRTTTRSLRISPNASRHGFDSYKVTYCTVDALLPGEREPQPTVATGMVSVPRRAGRLSTVAYQHGTSVSFYDALRTPTSWAPSPRAERASRARLRRRVRRQRLHLRRPGLPRARRLICPAASILSRGDRGFGGVDLLAAADRVLAGLHVQQDGNLFVFGFSQGSHAALALHRELESKGVDVTGTATVGGIFDVEQWFLSALANQTTVTLPLYMAYILLAYDDIYDVYRRKTDVFRQPYASTVDDLFDMKHFFDDVLAGMPPTTRALLTPSFAASFASDPETPLRVRLRQNAVDRWRPRAPVRLYQSPVDEEAPYDDALTSIERLRRAGADVTVQVLPGFDHINSWIQALPRAVAWFRSLAGTVTAGPSRRRAGRRVGLPVFVVTPAGDGALGSQAAGVFAAGRNLEEGARGGRRDVAQGAGAPAVERAVDPDANREVGARRHLAVRAGGWVRRASQIAAPAGHRAIGPHGAVVKIARGDLDERA